jgi:hypothetical protein
MKLVSFDVSIEITLIDLFFNHISYLLVLADPSAPSMGSTNTITSSVSDNNIDHSMSMTQSPVTPHETSYVPSPTTSTGYGYHNTSFPVSARSVTGISENQQAVSPKLAYAQQPHSPQQEYHHHQQPQIMKPAPPKHQQQPTLKPSPPPQVVLQQCKIPQVAFYNLD